MDSIVIYILSISLGYNNFKQILKNKSNIKNHKIYLMIIQKTIKIKLINQALI